MGDYVDIVANGAVHKGMPYKVYHGKTGRVWNVTKRALGVEVNKLVRLWTARRLHLPSRVTRPVDPDEALVRLAGGEPHHSQAHSCARRARAAVAVPRGLPQASRQPPPRVVSPYVPVVSPPQLLTNSPPPSPRIAEKIDTRRKPVGPRAGFTLLNVSAQA